MRDGLERDVLPSDRLRKVELGEPLSGPISLMACPLLSLVPTLEMLRSLLFAALVTLTASAAAQTSVRDSVRMSLSVYTFHNTNGPYTSCGNGILATWPNVLTDILGREGRYSDYGKVATEGMYVPSGHGEATTNPQSGIFVPPGSLGHNPQLGNAAGNGDACARGLAGTYQMFGGVWTLLNGRPFRVTDWYATFSVPSGTPIALFEWEPADGRAVDFDASFESGQSHEADAAAPSGRVPVASYAWDFGDGQAGSGARPSHTFTEAGAYEVTLTVTDDDGETDDYATTVTVEAAHLTVRITSAPEAAAVGDSLEVVATVTNSGTEPVTDVQAGRAFTYAVEYPEAYNAEGNVVRPPTLRPAPLGEDETVTRERLEPGESFEVRREYVVGTNGSVSVGSDAPTPIEVDVRWIAASPVSATYGSGEPVSVRTPCEDGGCDSTHVAPLNPPELHYTVEVQPSTVAVGSEFEVLVAVRNDGDGRADDVHPTGELQMTSEDGAVAHVVSGPDPASIARLAPAVSDTLRYTVEADSAGILTFEATIVGTAGDGTEVTAARECTVETGRQRSEAVPGCSAEAVDSIVVTTTGDEPNNETSQIADLCDVDPDEDGLQCTLRAAIRLANTRGGATITFDIDGDPLISVLEENGDLPEIEHPTTIDGTTQAGGFVLVTGYESIFEAGAGDAVGIAIGPGAGGSTIRGLVVNSFGAAGIRVERGADDCLIEGNRIGTDFTGTQAAGGGGASCRLMYTDGPGLYNCPEGAFGAGLHIRSSGNRVLDNVIAGNTHLAGAGGDNVLGAVQVLIDVAANGNTIQRNQIGYGATGTLLLTPMDSRGGYDSWNGELCNDVRCFFPIGISVFGSGNVVGGTPEGANRIGGFGEDVWIHTSSDEIAPEFRAASGAVPRSNVVSYNQIGTGDPVLEAVRFDGGIALAGSDNEAHHNTLTTTRSALTVVGRNTAYENTATGWTAPTPSADPLHPDRGRYGAIVLVGNGPTVHDNTVTSGAWGVVLANEGQNATVRDNQIEGGLGGLIATLADPSESSGQFKGTVISGNTVRAPGSEADGLVFIDGQRVQIVDNTIEAGGVGVALPLDSDRGDPQHVLVSRNAIAAPVGIDLGGDGVTSNDLTDLDDGPNDLLNFPLIQQVVREGTTLRLDGLLQGAFGADYTVEVFANATCGGYGGGLLRHGPGETYLAAVAVSTSPTDLGEHAFALTADGLTDTHRYATLTASRLDLGVTSEFSHCIAIASPGDVARADVGPDETGILLQGADAAVGVGPGAARSGTAARTAAHPGGTLFATRYNTSPDTLVFAEASATAPDGSVVTPTAGALRYWRLAETGLTTVPEGETPAQFEVCLSPSGVVYTPDVVVVVARDEQTGRWAPLDTRLTSLGAAPYLCASGLAALGEFGLGGPAQAFVGTTDGELPGRPDLPPSVALDAYPNPAAGRITLRLDLPAPARARVVLFDALGRWVATLDDRERSAGHHTLNVSVADLPVGVYAARLETPGAVVTRPLTVVR